MLLSLYKTALSAATPLLESHLTKRMANGKEDPARAHERRGLPQRARGTGPLVWLHGASVGESVALLSTVGRIRKDYPGFQVMVTTGTVSSAKMMADRLPEGAFHQYIPVDHPRWAASFLEHWKPDLVIWSESDFWPAMLSEIRARKIPAVLLNGCMSEQSFRKWRIGRGLIRSALQAFDLVLAQNPGHAERLLASGARNVKVSANLKYASDKLPFDPAKREELQQATAGRTVIVWASSHPGEEEIMCRIHAAMKQKHPQLLTVIVPRHVHRGAEARAVIENAGLKVSVRSEGAMPQPQDDIYLADTMGELGLFYRLAAVAIVGGSFCFRSHNPIEPAQLGCVVMYGPVTGHIQSLCDDFEARRAAIRVPDAAALQEKIAAYLDNPAAFAPVAKAALDWTEARSHIVEEVAADLAPFLKAAADKTA
jgi:3-deoxy-D-manno-octulosonic-acid transferase